MQVMKTLGAFKYFSRDTHIKIINDKYKHIIESLGGDTYKFINSFIDINSSKSVFLETSTRFNVQNLLNDDTQNFVNLRRLNDIRYLNKFFETVNEKLPADGIFIGTGETFRERRRRIFNKFPKVFAYPYYFGDFIFKRLFPKFLITKKIYFFLTQGRNRVLSRAEILGRLYSCGFVVIGEEEINNQLWFAAKKVKDPAYNSSASYGPLFKMSRYGKDGKMIGVYKFRTMHPYAEYLQSYVYKMNNLDKGGKLKNDFRVTYYGRIFRKLWIDELPMIINWLKGDLKLVGVRPLSPHYLGLYKKDLVERRQKVKPGLVPPFYVDLPQTLDEIMASEEKYLEKYEKHPFKTDVEYFFKGWYNILIKRARSK